MKNIRENSIWLHYRLKTTWTSNKFGISVCVKHSQKWREDQNKVGGMID